MSANSALAIATTMVPRKSATADHPAQGQQTQADQDLRAAGRWGRVVRLSHWASRPRLAYVR